MVRPASRTSKQRIVLVSGPPGAGKTTLARPLAERLGFALLTKDDIKETLWTCLDGQTGDAAFSRRVGAAAMDLLWSLAPNCPAVVLEANFRTTSPSERGRVEALLQSGAQLVEIHCRLPLDEASHRFAARARQQRHHPAHVLRQMSPERLAEYEAPFALSPVIEIDTTRPIDLDSLLARIHQSLTPVP